MDFFNRAVCVTFVSALCLASCGGNGGGGDGTTRQPPDTSPPPETLFTVSGTVSGLAGTGLTLLNNFSDELVIDADGSFTFRTALKQTQYYNVTITLPPWNPYQVCSIANGSGQVGLANISDINVTCTTPHAGIAFTGMTSPATVAPGRSDLIRTFAIDDATGQLRPRTIASIDAELGKSSSSMITDRTGRFLYAISSSGIAAFDIESHTGVLTPKSPFFYSLYTDTLTRFLPGFSVHPSGSPIVVAKDDSKDPIVGYTIDSNTGGLNRITTSSFKGDLASSLTYDLAGRFAYVYFSYARTIRVASADATTGALTEVSHSQLLPNYSGNASLVVSPNGKFVYSTNPVGGIFGFNVDATTGTLAILPGFPIKAIQVPRLLGVHPSGKFLYIGGGNLTFSNVFTLAMDDKTGDLVLPPGNPFIVASYSQIVNHPSGRFIYVNTGSGIRPFTVDTHTGTMTPITGLPTPPISTISIDPSGKFLYATSDRTTLGFSIDQATGTLTPFSSIPSTSVQMPQMFLRATTAISFKSDFAYVPNRADNTVSAFAIDNAGRMTAVGGPIGTGASPSNVAMDLRFKFLYVVNAGDDTISGYRINGASGGLTPMSAGGFPTGTGPSSMTIEPSGRFAYVSNAGTVDSINAYAIDSAGLLAPIGSPSTLTAGSDPQGLAVHPNGSFLYEVNRGADSISQFAINQSSGQLTSLQGFAVPVPVATGTAPVMIKIDPSGKYLYVANSGSNDVSAFSIDLQTGSLTPIGTVPAGAQPQSLDVDPTGRFLYVANRASNSISAYAIDQSSGVPKPMGLPIGTSASPIAVQVDYSGKYLYVASETNSRGESFAIDPLTGVLTPIANSAVATGALPSAMIISTRTL